MQSVTVKTTAYSINLFNILIIILEEENEKRFNRIRQHDT